MWENHLKWFSHERCNLTNTPVWQVELINVEQVKRAKGQTKKNIDWADTKIYRC